MARTYVYGYQGLRYTRPQIEGFQNFNTLNPEIQRRWWAMANAAQDVGTDLGVGSAWRSRARAQQLYEQYINGERSAPAAPPDRTYHCEKNDGYCYAIDAVGDLTWMNRECARFGLRHFANVNEEPWHVQPVELPTACSPSFQGRVLPTIPLGDDDMAAEDVWHVDLNQDEPGSPVPAYGALMALFEGLVQGRGFSRDDHGPGHDFWQGIREIVREEIRNAPKG